MGPRPEAPIAADDAAGDAANDAWKGRTIPEPTNPRDLDRQVLEAELFGAPPDRAASSPGPPADADELAVALFGEPAMPPIPMPSAEGPLLWPMDDDGTAPVTPARATPAGSGTDAAAWATLAVDAPPRGRGDTPDDDDGPPRRRRWLVVGAGALAVLIGLSAAAVVLRDEPSAGGRTVDVRVKGAKVDVSSTTTLVPVTATVAPTVPPTEPPTVPTTVARPPTTVRRSVAVATPGAADPEPLPVVVDPSSDPSTTSSTTTSTSTTTTTTTTTAPPP